MFSYVINKSWLDEEKVMVKECCTKGKNTPQTIMDMLHPTKVFRIYEDDDWVIDRVGDSIRVSYFKDGHFVDEQLIRKEDFE